jgi:hypothetical protein
MFARGIRFFLASWEQQIPRCALNDKPTILFQQPRLRSGRFVLQPFFDALNSLLAAFPIARFAMGGEEDSSQQGQADEPCHV